MKFATLLLLGALISSPCFAGTPLTSEQAKELAHQAWQAKKKARLANELKQVDQLIRAEATKGKHHVYVLLSHVHRDEVETIVEVLSQKGYDVDSKRVKLEGVRSKTVLMISWLNKKSCD